MATSALSNCRTAATARTVAAVIAKVLYLPPGHYIDDFIAALLAGDATAVDDLWEFLVDVLCLKLQRSKFKFGTSLLYLGMELRFLHDGILYGGLRRD